MWRPVHESTLSCAFKHSSSTSRLSPTNPPVPSFGCPDCQWHLSFFFRRGQVNSTTQFWSYARNVQTGPKWVPGQILHVAWMSSTSKKIGMEDAIKDQPTDSGVKHPAPSSVQLTRNWIPVSRFKQVLSSTILMHERLSGSWHQDEMTGDGSTEVIKCVQPPNIFFSSFSCTVHFA